MQDRRQALLGAAALALAGVTGWAALRDARALPEFEPIPSAPGFRRLASGGAVSLPPGGFATIGLEGAPGGGAPGPAAGRSELCAALFGPPGIVLGRPDAGAAPLPVAAFSDYRCPNCPDTAPRLEAVPSPALRLVWHEWPLFGAASELAARVALAAAEQGGHHAMHRHLMRRPLRPSSMGIRAAAEAAGLDAERLVRAMESPGIPRRLAETARLAGQLGLRGTPSLVLGDIVVEGLPARAMLRRLVGEAVEPCTGI